MRCIGKLVIMTDKEWDGWEQQRDTLHRQAQEYCKMSDEAEAARDNAIAIARRFHAAGGYSHTLPKVKEQLRHATTSLAHCIDLLVAWRPLVASLETTPGQFVDRQFDTQVSVTRELCGIVGPAWYGLLATPAEVAMVRALAHDDDVSDADAAADFDVVGTSVAAERRQP